MLEESNPRSSAKWKPHSTFAQEMGLTDKGIAMDAPAEEIHHAAGEKFGSVSA